MSSLERGLQQALAGEGRVTTGEEIARRTADCPPLATHKQPVTLRLAPASAGVPAARAGRHGRRRC
ncbi:MAG: hypothetical protein LBE78_04805 [Burkholderiaceae bacterium]|nr:hypothetical protein [Burkholderiaceae bacterium]